MRQVITGVQGRIETLFGKGIGKGQGLLRDARERWGWLDHQARAFERYQERRGDSIKR